MVVTEPPVRPLQRAPAKARILDVAGDLFYGHGIQNVGVDRIISASSVTKATFYKHYRAKDNLIVEYVKSRHQRVREQLLGIIESAPDPETALRQIAASIADEIVQPGFRGCPFINAAAEFPSADHPVRMVVTAHREWYVETLADLLRQLRHPMPGDAADELLLARDGALAGGYAGDPVAATAALARVTDRVLAEVPH